MNVTQWGLIAATIIVSVISGFVHLGNTLSAKMSVTHFGQFFAGVEFFIIAVFLVVALIDD